MAASRPDLSVRRGGCSSCGVFPSSDRLKVRQGVDTRRPSLFYHTVRWRCASQFGVKQVGNLPVVVPDFLSVQEVLLADGDVMSRELL